MKIFMRLILGCAFLSTSMLFSQKNDTKSLKPNPEDEGPAMLKFEPNFEMTTLLEREALKQKIKALDTLDISERKRQRMVKALYKESRSVNFKKSILVDTEFEEDEF